MNKSELDKLLERVDDKLALQGKFRFSAISFDCDDLFKLAETIRAYRRHLEHIAAVDDSNPLARWAKRGLRNGEAIAAGSSINSEHSDGGPSK